MQPSLFVSDEAWSDLNCIIMSVCNRWCRYSHLGHMCSSDVQHLACWSTIFSSVFCWVSWWHLRNHSNGVGNQLHKVEDLVYFHCGKIWTAVMKCGQLALPFEAYQAFVYIRVSKSATRKPYETGGGDLWALSVSTGITDGNVKHTNAHLRAHTHTHRFAQLSFDLYSFSITLPLTLP